MLKRTEEELESFESDYPGIRDTIRRIEAESLPACTRCNSEDTARVGVGLVQQSMLVSASTTKFKLVPNKTKSMGDFFCNGCESFFDLEKAAGSGDEG